VFIEKFYIPYHFRGFVGSERFPSKKMEMESKISVQHDGGIPIVKSCGFLIFRNVGSSTEFLLMRHANRYDLPKGHVNNGKL
jgi:hypothetical protein